MQTPTANRNCTNYIAPTIAVSGNVSAAAVPRGDGVESRGWGRGAPQSSSSPSLGAPARSNKIYTYDVVFFIGETNINASSKTPPTLSPIKKSNPQRKFPNKFGSGIHLAERRTNVRALPCRERDKSRSNASLTECLQNIRQISFDFRHAVCYNTIFKEDSIE